MRTFIRLAVIIVLLCFLLAGAACARTALDNSGSFTVSVPPGWNIEPSEDLISLWGPGGIPQFTVISDPAEGVNLQMFALALIKELSCGIKDFKLVSSYGAKVGGDCARVWIYTGTRDDVALKFKTYALIHNKEIYTVIFATTEERYKDDSKGCDYLVGSWNWI